MSTSASLYNELLWAQEAAGQVPCENAPDLFFGDAEDEAYTYNPAYAKSLCLACPVLELCAKYALSAAEPYGVWGGLTAGERKKLIRRGAPAFA